MQFRPEEAENRPVRHPRVIPAKTPAQQSAYAPPGRQPLGRSAELREQPPRRERQAMQPPPETQTAWRITEMQEPEPPKKRKKHSAFWAAVMLVCLLGIAAIGVFLSPQLFGVTLSGLPNYAFMNGSIITLDLGRFEQYKTYRQYLASDVIYPGVYVDGVHVGGMSVQEAKAALESQHTETAGVFSVTINVGNKSWVIDSARVPMTRDYDEVLAKAYAQGRTNTVAIRGTGTTPFQERLNAALALRTSPVSYETVMSYDKDAIRTAVDSICEYVNRDPVDSQVATFDFNTKAFTFTDDTPGAYIDPEALYAKVTTVLDGGDYFATLVIEPQKVLATTTKAELMNAFTLVASYTTDTTSNANRNTNIELSAAAINGTTVMPGETFSFNQATGQRTEAKGYKEAIAIAGGQSVPDIGGGVCQTSSTLFNAVARANLKIIERSPHAWPSSYVEKGMDATVNWPNLDFKFQNNTDWPVFIVSYYKNRKVTVELYGIRLGDGVSIDLKSVVTKTIPIPEGQNRVLDTSLAPGESKVTVKARAGYVVETYQVWYKNGAEYDRTLLCTSTYKAYQETVAYNQ